MTLAGRVAAPVTDLLPLEIVGGKLQLDRDHWSKR
jgi:hypothetical protein